MRILHVLATSLFSGAENVACQIIGLCADSDHEMIYCSPDGQIRESLEQRGISFEPIKSLTASELKKAIDRVKPDIIHTHDMRASYARIS